MLDADVDLVSPEEVLAAFKLTPAAQVQVVDLNDSSFSPAFRGESLDADGIVKLFLRDQVTEILSRFKERPELLSSELTRFQLSYADKVQIQQAAAILGEAERCCGAANHEHPEPEAHPARVLEERIQQAQLGDGIVDEFMRSALTQAASQVANGEIADRFTAEEPSLRELIEVLGFMTAEERSSFLKDFTGLAKESAATAQAVNAKIGNMMHFVPLSEQKELIQHLLATSNERSNSVVAEILDSTVTLADLTTLVESVGKEELLKAASALITEKVALADVSSAMRELAVAAAQDVTKLLADADSALAEMEEAYKGTRIWNEQKAMIGYNQKYFTDRLELSTSDEEKASLTEYMLFKLGAELELGTIFTHSEPNPFNGAPRRDWSLDELQKAEAALKSLQEGALLHTPGLFQFTRVASLGPGILGLRADNGVVLLTDFAVDMPGFERAHGGVDSLTYTLIHEIGHSMQFGNSRPFILQTPDGGRELSLGDPEFDFDEFQEVSDWELLSPERWKPAYEGVAVELDGKNYPLGEPIFHEGEWMILRFNQGLLFSHALDAQFSVISYSRTNPWEDFAEAFAEYHVQPERLIDFAPEKFEFFEQEFRRYAGDAEMLAKLRASKEAREVAMPQRSERAQPQSNINRFAADEPLEKGESVAKADSKAEKKD